MFANFPKDPHITTAEWKPHSRTVTIALFNAATMSDPKIGSTVARVGCRTVVAKCQKALADRSQEELYNAQPRGALCKKTYARCFFDGDGAALWAMQTGNVVAIVVVRGWTADTEPSPSPIMAFTVYSKFAAGL